MLETKKTTFPWYTLMITIICITMYALFYSLNEQMDTSTLYSKFGAPYAIQIYQGQYWGVFSNSFLHTNLYHITINILFLWILGAFIERRISVFNFFLLGLFASIITSIAQLNFSDDAGIGLAGVNYFFLGYIIVKSFKQGIFRLKGRYIFLYLAVFVILTAYYLNEDKAYNIGIAAMIAGLVFGGIIGLSTYTKKRIVPASIGLFLTLISSLSLWYAPWSAEWNYYKGYSAHEKGDFEEAKRYYENTLVINPDHTISKENLRYIAIDELCDLALTAHQNENYVLARKLYERVLKMDPNNNWAKENMSKLP